MRGPGVLGWFMNGLEPDLKLDLEDREDPEEELGITSMKDDCGVELEEEVGE